MRAITVNEVRVRRQSGYRAKVCTNSSVSSEMMPSTPQSASRSICLLIIHRPREQLLASAVDLFYQLKRDQRVMRNHVVRIGFSPACKLSWLVTNDPSLNFLAAGFQFHHDLGQKGRDHVVLFHPVFAK